MALDFTTSYAAIIKQEKQDDGTLLVYGKATDDAIDSDNQICDAGWLNRAMPEWFKSGGNIREQHSNIAAGVAKELDSKDDGHYISALVVDAQSVKKVEAGVLKGFSIGIRAPRIVRDTKAANGRIIDGQIVEVSLVDRPANPNAKLMLAKSNGIEVVQVEEMIEETLPVVAEDTAIPETVEDTVVETQDLPVEEVVEGSEKSPTATYAVALARALAPEIKKFDQATYDNARQALAQLIVIESGELAEGHDERHSLNCLVAAVHALFAWYEGEVAEGEVAEPALAEMENIELSANADCGCDGCVACKSDGGCKSTPCGKCMKMKSAEAHKCLECGCNVPQDSHGRSDVTTATMVSPSETPKLDEATIEKSTITPLPTIERLPSVSDDDVYEDSEDKTSEKSALSDDDINVIIEKAVKSATETVTSEIALLKSATEAAQAEVNKLQGELEAANQKAVNGGPKRSIIANPLKGVDEFTRRAIEYRIKSANTSDPVLARGYKELAAEQEANAKALQITD